MPGWHPDPAGSGDLRWWDGSSWRQLASAEPFLPVGKPAPNGFTFVWTPAPGWAVTPEGWYPRPGWEPEIGAPAPASDWVFWQCVQPSDEPVTQARIDGLNAASESRERERDDEAWGEVNLETVPLVWTPAPGWPPVPTGWAPPAGWIPDRKWPKAPANWAFWQHDPVVIRARQDRANQDLDARSRVIVAVPEALASELSRGERMWAVSLNVTRLAKSPLRGEVATNCVLPANHSATVRLDDAHARLHRVVCALRTYLLEVAYGVREVDIWLGELRRERRSAWHEYYQAIQNRLLASTELVRQRADAAYERFKRRPADPRLYSEGKGWNGVCQQLLAERSERSELIDALFFGRQKSGVSAPEWQEAEELAARWLRVHGFPDAAVTPPGADGGLDVVGRGIAAQVKNLSTPVGRPTIQQLVGANRHGARAACFSRAGYSASAVAFANQTDVALFTIDTSRDAVEPVNNIARAW